MADDENDSPTTAAATGQVLLEQGTMEEVQECASDDGEEQEAEEDDMWDMDWTKFGAKDGTPGAPDRGAPQILDMSDVDARPSGVAHDLLAASNSPSASGRML